MIVLASASPRRKELLSFITTDFKIVPADIDETVENNVPLEKRPEYPWPSKRHCIFQKTAMKKIL